MRSSRAQWRIPRAGSAFGRAWPRLARSAGRSSSRSGDRAGRAVGRPPAIPIPDRCRANERHGELGNRQVEDDGLRNVRHRREGKLHGPHCDRDANPDPP